MILLFLSDAICGIEPASEVYMNYRTLFGILAVGRHLWPTKLSLKLRNPALYGLEILCVRA